MSKTMLVLQPDPINDVPPPPPGETNEMLLTRINAGDGDAFWVLYQRHADLIRGVIARCLRDEDECEDVLREVFEEIRDRAVHYSPEMGRAIGWIMTLARRRAMDRARCTQLRQQLPGREAEGAVPAESEETRSTCGFERGSGLSPAAA